MSDTEGQIATSHAIERACDVLGTHCKFTADELANGQSIMEDRPATKEEHDEEQEAIMAYLVSHGKTGLRPRPFIPPLTDISPRAFAMMRRLLDREAWVNEPTLEAKLAMLGVVTDNPQALSDHLALLEISVRGEFANQKH